MNSSPIRWLSRRSASESKDLRLDRDIERGRRLVEDQQRRLARQRRGDERALPHAAAQLMRIGGGDPARLVDTHVGEQLAGAVHRRAWAANRRCSTSGSAIWRPTRHRRIQRRERVLEHGADAAPEQLAAAPGVEAAQVVALEQDARPRSRRPRRAGRGSRRRSCFCPSPIRRRGRAPRRGARSNETARAAVNRPPFVGIGDGEIAHRQQRHHRRYASRGIEIFAQPVTEKADGDDGECSSPDRERSPSTAPARRNRASC